MTALEIETLTRQNQYLKQRVAQLEEDVSNLSADSERLRQRLDRVSARPAEAPNPLGGGQ
jgi:cell division protein FtsB